jgi:hypothetical protein
MPSSRASHINHPYWDHEIPPGRVLVHQGVFTIWASVSEPTAPLLRGVAQECGNAEPLRHDMKPGVKVALVAGGYVVAAVLAVGVVAIRQANTNTADAQASSGMYAFGDAMTFVAVFGICALAPTGTALVFLRSYGQFWKVLSTLGLALAVTSLAAAIVFAVGRSAPPSPLATWAAFSVLRILVAPLFALTFIVCGVVAPQPFPRFAFLAATLLEVAVCVYAGCIWFLPSMMGRGVH